MPFTSSEGEAKQSRERSAMRWWTKCIAMVIAKTASVRNIAFKADMMSQAVWKLEAQTSFVIVTPEARGQEASSESERIGGCTCVTAIWWFCV